MSQNTTKSEREWGLRALPDFSGSKALVLPGAFYGACVSLMAGAGFSRAETVEEADIVVFIGGVDVNPALYDQRKLSQTQDPSLARDKYEIDIYKQCVNLNKKMFGICRGAQFLHVMNGGSLWQHVENHAGPDHWIYDLEDDCYVLANSYHHQMLQLNDTIDVLACCKEQESRLFVSDTMSITIGKRGDNNGVELEIEAGYYHDTNCFFVQGHPEVGNPEYKCWAMTKLHDFMFDHMDDKEIAEREGVRDLEYYMRQHVLG